MQQFNPEQVGGGGVEKYFITLHRGNDCFDSVSEPQGLSSIHPHPQGLGVCYFAQRYQAASISGDISCICK